MTKAPLSQSLKSSLKTQGSELKKLSKRVFSERVCVGVTGFSRAGKTSFITSLLYQLQHNQTAVLPAFSPALKGQLLGAKLRASAGDIATFPYQSGLQALSANQPRWPQATSALSQVELEIRYKPLKRALWSVGGKVQSLVLELRDYPGEWLLDLPMLEQSYAQWSEQQWQLAQQGLRAELGEALWSKLAAIDPAAKFDAQLCDDLSRELEYHYRNFQQAGLVMLQPGRLLMPDASLEWPAFLPLQLTTDSKFGRESWAAEMQSRFEYYKREVIKPFYREVFSGIDRQVVLVDVLASLSHGPEVFADTQRALTAVLESFNYGQNSLLRRWFKPKIERLLIAATKVDQVLPAQHDRVRALVAQLTAQAYREAQFEDIEFQCEAFAAIRSSQIEVYNNSEMLKGRLVDGGAALLAHPEIPEKLPSVEEWQALAAWTPHRLSPPKGLNLDQGQPLPHIRIDSILRELLGDCFK